MAKVEPGYCVECQREKSRTTVIDNRRICDECFYRLRDVPKT
jgi:hypothetical protein